jgi:hypothetical protein
MEPMSGLELKKYVVICDGVETYFTSFKDSIEEAVKAAEAEFDLTDDDFYVIEVSKSFKIKTSPRVVEEDNALFFLGEKHSPKEICDHT